MILQTHLTRNNLTRGLILTILSVFAFSVATPAIALADSVALTNHDDTVTAIETQEALEDIGGILSPSDQLVTKTDADSALVATTAGTAVDVPKDAEEGVVFGATDGPKIEVALPSAEQAGVARAVAPGVVAYDSGNGSANAVQATEDGGVRMLTIIDNPGAPVEYEYGVTLPDGGRIELTPEGSAVVYGGTGELLYGVGAPWAQDANGNPVETWFTTDGQSLTQHIVHNVPGVAYPLTADPFWNVFGNYLGCILGAGVPLGAAVVIAALPATWYALTAASSNPRTQTTIGKYIIWVKNRCGAFIRS